MASRFSLIDGNHDDMDQISKLRTAALSDEIRANEAVCAGALPTGLPNANATVNALARHQLPPLKMTPLEQQTHSTSPVTDWSFYEDLRTSEVPRHAGDLPA